MTAPPDPAALDFVLRLGRGLHRYGYPAHRLEETLVGVARRLGLEGQFFSMPTALFASFGAAADQRTFQIRVDPGAVELGRLAQLDAIGSDVAAGRLPPGEGTRALDAVMDAPAPYGALLTTAAFALTSGAAARFFGGGLREIAVAAAIGLATGAIAALSRARAGLRARVRAAGRRGGRVRGRGRRPRSIGPLSGYTATVAGLIVLIPGFSLTVAMIELATRNLVSGTARLAGAAGTFLAIGFGFALGTRLAGAVVGVPVETEPVALPAWTEIVALLAAPDRVHRPAARIAARHGVDRARRAPWPSRARAWGRSSWGRSWARSWARSASAWPATPTAARCAGWRSCPWCPGMLLIVPGSLGFRSLSSLVGGDTVPGVEAAFRMTLITVSLATGVLFANVLLPARRS